MSGSRRRFILPVGLFLLACSSLSIVAAQGRSHQPPIRQIELDHIDFDSCDYGSPERAATAVTPFCKSFTFLCHVRCLQRGDLQNPGNDPSAPSSAQTVEINRCNHIPNTHKMQVLCLCNNGVDLTAEIDYALEGVVDIADAGGDGTGTGEAGKIREVVYAATLTVTESVYQTVTLTSTTTMPAPPAVTTTKVEYKTVTITATAAAQAAVPTSSAADTLDSPKTSASEPTTNVVKESAGKDDLPITESNQTVISIDPVQTENEKTQENKETQESEETHDKEEAQANEEKQDDDDAREVAALPQLNEGPEGSFNEADWAGDPDAYQDPYLKEESIVPTDDQQQVYYDEAEVEEEEETGPLGNEDDKDDVDLEEKIDQSVDLQRRRQR